MTAEDIAAAAKAQVDRATPSNTVSVRRATVAALSPFTITMGGVNIVSPPKSPKYDDPIVGDVVLVLMDGPAPYVLEQISRTQSSGRMVAFVAGTANNLAYNNNAGAFVTVLTLPSTTFVSGRRYFVEWTWRAATTPTYWALYRDGVAAGPDFYHDYPNAGVIAYMGGTGSFYWTDSGAHTMSLVIRGQGANAGNVYSDSGGCYARIMDYGP